MTTHTPGPWTISTSPPVDYALTIHGASLKQSGGFPVVADILERTTDGTHEANARLIAAAPDLLEALQDMLSIYGVREEHLVGGSFITRTEVETCNEARAAVFKATGEPQ